MGVVYFRHRRLSMDNWPVIVRNDVVVDFKQEKSKHYARQEGCESAVISIKIKVAKDAPEKILPARQLRRQNLPVTGGWHLEQGAWFDRRLAWMDRGTMKRFMAPRVS
jgi:hypothetical protein